MVDQRGIITAEDAAENGLVDSWPLPSLNQRGRVVQSAKREGEARSKESIENVPRTARPKSLTAEDINKISKDAEEEGFKAGYEEGFSKGEIQGEKKGSAAGEAKAYEECKAKLDDEYARLNQLCEALSHPLKEQDGLLEQTLIDLVKHFSCELIQQEIDHNPESLRGLIATILPAIPAGSKNMQIYVNPEDARLLEDHLAEKKQAWPIKEDAELARGGCRIETDESLMDYSIEKRWRNMLNEINPRLANKGSDDASPE